MENKSRWESRFKMIVSVYLLLLDQKGHVLLSKRHNTGYCDGQFGLPAGHVDGQEEAKQALLREIKEEIGMTLQPENLELVHTIHRHCGDHERLDLFFSSRKWEGEPINAEPNKCSELRWVTMNDLPEETIDYYKQMFECIQADKPYSYFGW